MLEYVAGVIEVAPILAKMVIRRAADSLTLFVAAPVTIVIAVRAASFRTAIGFDVPVNYIEGGWLYACLLA